MTISNPSQAQAQAVRGDPSATGKPRLPDSEFQRADSPQQHSDVVQRVAWPQALLMHCCPLVEAHRRGLTPLTVKTHLPRETANVGIPVALRWIGRPFFGFSRKPYRVYRRLRDHHDMQNQGQSLLANPVPVGSAMPLRLTWGNKQMFDVVFQIAPQAGAWVKVQAADDKGHLIVDQYIVFNSSGWGRLRTHGIARLVITGTGLVQQVWGIDEQVMVNLPDWGSPVQVVGFPFQPKDIAAPYYDNQLQGYAPASLSGYDAAQQRLAIAAMLQAECPPIPGVPNSPAWPAPLPAPYLLALWKSANPQATPLMQAVTDCLRQTDDSSPTLLQRNYRLKKKLDGARRLDQPGPAKGSTQFDVPVVGMTMTNAATDSFAATALGYGTTDFPPTAVIAGANSADLKFPTTYQVPVGVPQTPFDYLVVAPLHLAVKFPPSPVMSQIDLEVASVAEYRKAPIAPQGLTAKRFFTDGEEDRPPKVDAPIAESRRLSWGLSPLPQAYGIAVARPSQPPKFLNSPRLGGQGYQPYTPQRPAAYEGAMPPDQPTEYIDKRGTQPLQVPELTNYYVIGTDVFGLWSTWSQTTFTSQPSTVKKPGLLKVDFVSKPGGAGNKIVGDLVIDFAWDWVDRTPGRIRFGGQFFQPKQKQSDPGGDPPASNPGTFTTVDGAVPGNFPIQVSFDANGKPKIDALDPNQPGVPTPPTASVKVLPMDPPYQPSTNSDVRKYRLIVTQVQCEFSGTTKKRGYAVYATASEKVRPNTFSAMVGPRVAYILDPRPPKLALVVPQVTWTSLPDAAGKARARLSWDAAPNAARYMVWCATETALVQHATQAGKSPPASTSIMDRSEYCKTMVADLDNDANPDHHTRRVFRRLTAKPLSATHYEVELPGSTDRLFLYRISAVTKNNVESPLSAEVFRVGVPKRIEPGSPRLLLRAGYPPQAAGIHVTAIPGPDPEANGYRLFRVRQDYLARELGLMGPPKFDEKSLAWQSASVVVSRGKPTEPCQILLDPQPMSWHPYYYRIQAVGGILPGDKSLGRYPGESLPSGVQQIYFHPQGPPLLNISNNVELDPFNLTNRFQFTTNLPRQRCPLGPAKIEIIEKYFAPNPGNDPKFISQAIVRFSSEPQDTINAVAPINTVIWPDFPMNKPKSTDVFIYRQGSSYTIVLPTVPFDPNVVDQNQNYDTFGVSRVLRLTDPLGRATEVELIQKVNPGAPNS